MPNLGISELVIAVMVLGIGYITWKFIRAFLRGYRGGPPKRRD